MNRKYYLNPRKRAVRAAYERVFRGQLGIRKFSHAKRIDLNEWLQPSKPANSLNVKDVRNVPTVR